MRPTFCLCAIALMPAAALAQNGIGTAGSAVPPAGDSALRTPHGTGFMRLFDIASPVSPRPLTGKERFIEYLTRTVGPVPLCVEAAVAGLDQGLDRPPEWHQEAGGYGKRLANVMAYNTVRQTLTFGMAALLDEDTRYFPSQSQSAWQRTMHALRSTLTARHHGQEVFSVAAITGVVGTALISRAWVPPSWRHGKDVAASIGVTLAGSAAFNVVREFLPDLLRHR